MSRARPRRVRNSVPSGVAQAFRPAVFCCATVVLFRCVTATAATLHDPMLRFRTLSTAHFIIYYHQGEDRLAERLAPIAEDTWQKLRRPLGATPPARTHVVLVDETELAHGSASPLPYNTIVMTHM